MNPLLLDTGGHFNPLSLSIMEDYADLTWRDRLPDKLENGDLNINIQKEINKSDLFAYMTSRHEMEHFFRHTSTELGVFLTIILLLRYASLVGYWRLKNGDTRVLPNLERVKLSSKQLGHWLQEAERFLTDFNFIFLSIWGYNKDITQGEAVNTFNRFFSKHFDIQEPILITSSPNKPHCPSPFHTYMNLLEASALFQEISFLDMYGFPISKSLELLRYNKRDFNTYFALKFWLQEELGFFSPASALCVRLSLDSRVPIICSPYKKPINWTDFHPGYRLLNYSSAAKYFLDYHKLSFENKPFNKKPILMYDYNISSSLLNYLCDASKEAGKIDMWFDEDVKRYEVSIQSIIDKMSDFGKFAAGSCLLGSAKHIFNHLINSFNSFKYPKTVEPLDYFYDIIYSFSEIDKINRNDEKYKNGQKVLPTMKKNSWPLFSSFNNQFNSVYFSSLNGDEYRKKEMPILESIFFSIRTIALEKLLAGESIENIRKYISKIRFLGASEETNNTFKNIILEGLEYNFSLPKFERF